jgi:hypothetical protein
VRHLERVIYNRHQVTIAGSVLVQSASGETKLHFRIDGEIHRKAVRSGTYSRGEARLVAIQKMTAGSLSPRL